MAKSEAANKSNIWLHSKIGMTRIVLSFIMIRTTLAKTRHAARKKNEGKEDRSEERRNQARDGEKMC